MTQPGNSDSAVATDMPKTTDGSRCAVRAVGSPVLGFLGESLADTDRDSASLWDRWGKRLHGLLTPKTIALVVGSLLAGYFAGLAITVILSHNLGVDGPVGGATRAEESFATLSHAIDSLWRGEAPQPRGRPADKPGVRARTRPG